MIETPIVRRVRIPTKGKPWYKRFWILITKPLMWELMADYRLPYYGSELHISKGFVMDFASIPRIFWWIPGLSPVGILLIPGLVHDYYYKKEYIERVYKDGTLTFHGEGEGRRFGDKLFLDVGKYINGVIGIDYIAWLAVRLLGWHAWNKHRKEEKKNEL